MKKLKELRNKSRYTQEDLAKMMKKSQQTIARWESGKSEPNISELRDLAIIFGTSVDEIVDFCKSDGEVSTCHMKLDGTDGFWGHIGVMLPGATKSKWYPVGLGEANRFGNQTSKKWAIVETLNNKQLLINLEQVTLVRLLDEACDPVTGDWELGPTDYYGAPKEIYNCLQEYFYDEESLKASCSDQFLSTIKDYVTDAGLNYDNFGEKFCYTNIHLDNGQVFSFSCEEEDLVYAASILELSEDEEEEIGGLQFTDTSGCVNYFSMKKVAFIEIPLSIVLAFARDNDDF